MPIRTEILPDRTEEARALAATYEPAAATLPDALLADFLRDRGHGDVADAMPWRPVATVVRGKYLDHGNGEPLTLGSDGQVSVRVEWHGPTLLDRPSTGGWGFTDDRRGNELAERLALAINLGRAYTNAKLDRDVNGRTYIVAETTQFFHGRHMAKSLTAVGV